MESTIGRYRLLKRLATGGMGEVYLAAQTGAQGFQKFVALKRVAASAAADPELISLFLDEARLVATLSHRSIVQVTDLGQDEHGFFVAMEFVQGPSVRALLDRLASLKQKLAPTLALDIAAQVGDALACAYYSRAPDGTPLRIIHRDVSPRNILVSVSGDVKLIDFGIAQSMRQVGALPSLTGKLAYMSPEQLRSEPLNARSDLFSLGIVLCEMLGGENPFARTDPKEIVAAIQREEPRLPSAKDPTLAPCDAVLKRLLAKLPSERFADGIELAEALAELRAHFPKPPKRLGAVVSDQFGVEISDLLREASQSSAKLETGKPASRPPAPALSPAPRESVKDAGLGSDAASPTQAHTPSIYHRVTQPYLSIPKDVPEVTQPDLVVPKVLRSDLATKPGADAAKTQLEPVAQSDAARAAGAPTPVLPEADSDDVEEVSNKEITPPIGLPSLPPTIDLPELKELAQQKAAEDAAAVEPEPAAAEPARVEPPPAPPVKAAAEPGPGEQGFDESKWYKNSIPPARPPARPSKPEMALPADLEITLPLRSKPPPESAPAAGAEKTEAPAPPSTAAGAPPPLPRLVPTALPPPVPVSAETTLPGIRPARRRGAMLGLPVIALIAVLIGVGIGLYLVREPAPQAHVAPPAPPPVVVAPTPPPAPAPAVEPPAPPMPPVEPLVVLAPLVPLQPLPPPPVIRAVDKSGEPHAADKQRAKPDDKHAVDKPKPEEKTHAAADKAKPEEKADKPPPVVASAEPKKEPEAPYHLVCDGSLGNTFKPMSGTGAIRLGESEGMAVHVNYVASADGLKASLDCQPWAIAAVNGLSVGKTPISLDLKEQPLKVELRRPNVQTVTIHLAARKH